MALTRRTGKNNNINNRLINNNKIRLVRWCNNRFASLFFIRKFIMNKIKTPNSKITAIGSITFSGFAVETLNYLIAIKLTIRYNNLLTIRSNNSFLGLSEAIGVRQLNTNRSINRKLRMSKTNYYWLTIWKSISAVSRSVNVIIII